MSSTRTIAGIFLVLGVLTSLLPPSPHLGVVSVLLSALPYVTLFLATAASRNRAAVAGGGIALLAVDLFNKLLALVFPGLLSQLTGDGQQRLWIYSLWGLSQAPASTVFVLPIGWMAGALLGRAFRVREESAPGPPPDPSRVHSWTVEPVFWGGAVIVFGTTVIWGRPSLGALAFAVWGMLPYALHRLLGRWIADPWPLAVGGIAILLGEVYARVQVFIFPRSSTAALLLLFSPVYLACILLPAGLGVGWLLGRGWRRFDAAGRAMMTAAVAACVLLAIVVAFRPDLLPGPVARRVSVKERIGSPRVVTGGDAFTRTPVSDRRAWFQVGDLDGAPGEDLAAIDSRGAVLLDPVTGAERARIPFADPAGRKWNWFSRLVRDGGELLIAQTGGGFQDVEVLDLDGHTRWSFHPDPSLPPIALVARDLVGDGRPEFYSASGRSVYRLDSLGKVVWERRLDGIVHALDAVAARGGQPGMLLTVDSQRRVRIWDADGTVVKELGLAGDADHYKFIEWRGTRALIGGIHTLAIRDLDGRLLLERPLEDFAYQDALTVRFDDTGAPFLVVLAAAPRDAKRWRLLVVSPSGETLYDEILGEAGAILAAPDDDTNHQVLLLASDGLTSYRRRP
jgi:hypothetical protein